MTKQELQNTIGQNLHRIRIQQRLTREELAEKVGISATFYANLESGNKMMSIVTLRKLADALSISTDALLYEDCENQHINSITMMLHDQPEQLLSFVEKVTRLCVSEASQEAVRSKAEGVTMQDGCTV